jgi:anti-sigma-K factor RskA
MNRKIRLRTRGAFLVLAPNLFLAVNLWQGKPFWQAMTGALCILAVLAVYYYLLLHVRFYRKR